MYKVTQASTSEVNAGASIPAAGEVGRSTSSANIGAATLAALESGPSRINGKPDLPFINATRQGEWPAVRPQSLAAPMLHNLGQLRNLSKGEQRLQSQREIYQHWHVMSDAEKVELLKDVSVQYLKGDLTPNPTPENNEIWLANQHYHTIFNGDPEAIFSYLKTSLPVDRVSDLISGRRHGPAVSVLHSLLSEMSSAQRSKLLAHLNPGERAAVQEILEKKPDITLIDTGYSYKKYLKFNDGIAVLPPEAMGKKVAIVGSGAAGTVAARELMKIGLTPVIIEAEDRVGGRLESRPYYDGETKSGAFSEMGAMRFPPTGETWFHYLKQFGVKTDPNFPNPGKINTKLFYRNEVIDWPAGNTAPSHPVLQKVGRDFEEFATSLMMPLEEARAAHDTDKMDAIWQTLVSKYKDMSFQAAVLDGLKEQKGWGKTEMDAFGALGIGTGGFGPLYQVNFVEILRVMVNKLENRQNLLPEGTTAALQQFYSEPVTRPDGTKVSLNDTADIRLQTKVTAVKMENERPTLTTVRKEGDANVESTEAFDAVIVTATPPALQRMGLTVTAGPGKTDPLSDTVKSALMDLHMMDSSKLFIRTPTKFWLDEQGKPRKDVPQSIQTDQSPHGIYCLDYPGMKEGVVLVSYTWGDKSTKLMGMEAEERLAEFKKVIEQVSPEFARNLVPVNDEIHVVDWQATPHQYGAFKLNTPGQEASQQEAFYQYLSVNEDHPDADTGVYVAGDSISHTGGWVEGAVTTALNAAVATAVHLGGTVPENSPLSLDKNKFDYGAA
jgi:tryptophan 2-monooxygenase